jgi:hypothetical protein
MTFSLLCSSPVHKEAKVMMNHRNSNGHVAEDSKGRNAAEQADDEA